VRKHSTLEGLTGDFSVDFRHCQGMGDFATSLIDLVLGRSCAGCDEPGVLLCHECTQALQPCTRLRRGLDVSDLVEDLRIPVVCALDYRGATRQVLYRYKDHRIRQLAISLSPALAESITFAAHHVGIEIRQTLLTPLPTRRSSIRRRGFDSTAHLLQCSARLTGAAGMRHLLTDVRTHGAAKHVGAFEREQRAIGAFQVRKEGSLPTQPVILVDDIVTTGATVKEAVETLLLAGVQVAAVATVAGTP